LSSKSCSGLFHFTTNGDMRYLQTRRIECTEVRDKTIIPDVILFKPLHKQMNTLNRDAGIPVKII